MNTNKFAVIGVAVAIVLMVALLLSAFIVFPSTLVRAEEIELDENAGNDHIVNGYDQAQDKAETIVEELELKEYLNKYFDENLSDLIITITISVLTAFIFLASIFFTVRKLIVCIKKYGVESDATKEVIGQLTTQLKDTQKAMAEIEETKKRIEENNAELKSAVEKLSVDNQIITKVLKVAFTNDPSLVERGYASQINEIIEEQ